MTHDGDVLVFAHIGDLHLTDAKQRNFGDFLAIAAQIETECAGTIDFVVLPGDNADNGLPAQYALAKTGLKMLSAPVHVIPGDHDMEQGNLHAFYEVLGAAPLPKAVVAKGTRCLFLDIVGNGGGGPDFRIGASQMSWIEAELRDARACGQTSLIFAHSYPDDLKGEGETEELNRLIADHDVALVDMGHSHYDELANDGWTIFATTRSTGQIEEGPVGCAIATFDGGVVSWRFKSLDDALPFVIVTAPADHRLLRRSEHAMEGSAQVRAVVLGRHNLRSVSCRIEDGEWIPMALTPGGKVWAAYLPVPAERIVTITVQAVDETGRPGQHTIRAATRAYIPPARIRDGSDADSVGAWPENGIYGTQLGPNRNAKPGA
jgi:hypothetical protein